MKPHTKILLGLVAGTLLGGLAKVPSMTALQQALIGIEPVGIAFIRLVTMVVIPLVVASIFVGVGSLGDVRRLGRIGGKTLAYFLATTVIAATIGLTVARVAGLGMGQLPDSNVAAASLPAESPSLVQSLIEMVPQNPFASAARGDLLPLIIAVCIFAAAATAVDSDGKRALLGFFHGVNDVSMVVIRWLMRLAPGAVFVLIAATVARSGFSLLARLAAYALVVVIAMAIHVTVTLLPALWFGARMGVGSFVRGVADALLMAFSTASSNVTLPVSMAAARDRLGLSEDVVSFVPSPTVSRVG